MGRVVLSNSLGAGYWPFSLQALQMVPNILGASFIPTLQTALSVVLHASKAVRRFGLRAQINPMG